MIIMKNKEMQRLQVRIRNSLRGGSLHELPFPDPKSNPLTWYACGPTVYDSSHLGHARYCFNVKLSSHFLFFETFIRGN